MTYQSMLPQIARLGWRQRTWAILTPSLIDW